MNTRRTFLKSAIAGTAGLGISGIDSQATEPKPLQVDRRSLGRIATPVSILGLGLGSAFTKPYGSKPEEAQSLLHHALNHGINYWDTCRGYANSEELIGPVVKKRRNDIFLVTKSKGRSYDALMRDVETSLHKLQTDRLNLLHIWNLPSDANLDEIETGALKAVRKLQNEKVVPHFGITGHSGAGILIEAIKRFDPDAVLTVFPCTREDGGRYEDELLPLAREKKMGVIAMKTVRKARNADLIGSDLIRYALSLDGICTSIVGLDTLGHLKENASMASNFKPMDLSERTTLHQHAVTALAGVPTPWEQPGYEDGSIA